MSTALRTCTRLGEALLKVDQGDGFHFFSTHPPGHSQRFASAPPTQSLMSYTTPHTATTIPAQLVAINEKGVHFTNLSLTGPSLLSQYLSFLTDVPRRCEVAGS